MPKSLKDHEGTPYNLAIRLKTIHFLTQKTSLQAEDLNGVVIAILSSKHDAVTTHLTLHRPLHLSVPP